MSEVNRESVNQFRERFYAICRNLEKADKKNYQDVCEKAMHDLRAISLEFCSAYEEALMKKRTSDSKCEGLSKEVERLASDLVVMANKETGCAVGPWCKECVHSAAESATYAYFAELNVFYMRNDCGNVLYCKKHIHDICPEFEKYGGNT